MTEVILKLSRKRQAVGRAEGLWGLPRSEWLAHFLGQWAREACHSSVTVLRAEWCGLEVAVARWHRWRAAAEPAVVPRGLWRLAVVDQSTLESLYWSKG